MLVRHQPWEKRQWGGDHPPLVHSLEENRLDADRRRLNAQTVAAAWTDGRALSKLSHMRVAEGVSNSRLFAQQGFMGALRPG